MAERGGDQDQEGLDATSKCKHPINMIVRSACGLDLQRLLEDKQTRISACKRMAGHSKRTNRLKTRPSMFTREWPNFQMLLKDKQARNSACKVYKRMAGLSKAVGGQTGKEETQPARFTRELTFKGC